ncbi:hypothetical protein [Clostridium sp.]|uniref:hypothetical protein n=1 Tax=Clostridium sp. TaxID=1506 RepID=UPI002FCC5159
MGNSILSKLFKLIFNKKENLKNRDEKNSLEKNINKVDDSNYEIDEEDKLVVALAASIMAGKDKPKSHFHISKITRIDNNNLRAAKEQISHKIEEEDKLVVALAASIMAGKDKPNSYFHVSRITRIDNRSGTEFNRSDYEINEEEKLVVALGATILAGQDKPNSHFRISKISRIS